MRTTHTKRFIHSARSNSDALYLNIPKVNMKQYAISDILVSMKVCLNFMDMWTITDLCTIGVQAHGDCGFDV